MSDDIVDELANSFDNKCLLRDCAYTAKYGPIPKELTHFECPFSWKYDFLSVDYNIDNIERKLSEMNDEDEELLPWKTFVLNLILCYEYAKSGDLEESMEKQMECDSILDDKSNEEFKPSAPFMNCGLRHISLACKCFLLHSLKSHDELEKIMATIVSYEDLQMRDRASILCVKGAYCSELGYKGIKESMELFEKAIAMDKECAEWSFLLGRSLGRLRRMEKRNAIPDPRELKALERAVDISNNVSFMVLLAQAYRETARNLSICKKKDMNTYRPYCDSLNEKSANLYREVLKQGKDNVHVLVRCALGLIRLPKPWKDLDEAKTCILKALDRAPQNPMANHVAGQYYSQVDDINQAMHYLVKAAAYGVYGAEIDLISSKRMQNKSYVPIADLQRLLEVYKEAPHQEATLCYLGTYFYIVQDNFKEAFKYWLQVIELDIESEKLKLHYDVASPRRHAININRVVVTELINLLDAGNITDGERCLYDKVISKYIDYHPGLVTSATEIDVSKYRNREFEHRSWRNVSYSKDHRSSSQCVPPTKDSEYRSQVPSHGRGRNNPKFKSHSSNAPSGPFHGHPPPRKTIYDGNPSNENVSSRPGTARARSRGRGQAYCKPEEESDPLRGGHFFSNTSSRGGPSNRNASHRPTTSRGRARSRGQSHYSPKEKPGLGTPEGGRGAISKYQ